MWPGWCASRDRGESRAQAATDRASSWSPEDAEPLPERPADLRIGVALPQSRANPEGRHRLPALNAPGVSSSVGASQVPPTVLVEPVPKDARTEGAEGRTHPGHRRAQVAQSSVRLSADCAHHRAHVRGRHRQEHRLPRGETLSARPGRHRALVVVVHRTHHRQPVERGPLSRRVHRAPELLGARGHGPVYASSRRSRRAPWSVNGADLCRMFNAAIHGQHTPRHLSTDHDPLFEAHRWTANLRILEIDEIKTVPHVPLSHPSVERLVGTMRREFLDHVLFWNARDLERKLAEFQTYYAARSHASLDGHTPLTFAGGPSVVRAELNNVRWISHCRDLVQLPVAA